MEKIFVNIASYRDPELIPTLKDLISKAKYPKNINIGIAWQHSSLDIWDNLNFIDFNLKILDINSNESKGVCWARSKVQELYYNEEYTLQIDSHHRFIENWDEKLIQMIKNLQTKGYKKPLLTTYVPAYDPIRYPEGKIDEPWGLIFDRFIPEGAIFTKPSVIPNWKNLENPIPSRFLSAHFIFTLGQFNKEILYDPNLYFHGEEISLAARSFTWGYDLFCPNEVILWHEYTRKHRVKQWDDDNTWYDKNLNSHRRNRKLFGIDGEEQEDLGEFGFGKERTLNDYEIYSGIKFSTRGVQKSTIDNKIPPNSIDEKYEVIFKHCIDLSYDDVPEKDYEFWAVIFEDKDGNVIHRKDIIKDEIPQLYNDPDGYIKIWREFYSFKPYKWIVWPFSASKQWCNRIEKIL